MFYFMMLSLLLSVGNMYVVWLLMEISFLFFFLFILGREGKSVGLVIYYFFQSFMSLFLLMALVFGFEGLIMVVLFSKLGVFPFFYWLVVVSVKVSLVANYFVLSFQKLSVFWLFWLLNSCGMSFLLGFVYCSMFFVIVNLLLVSDFWLLLVYSSIGNTGMILMAVWGSSYLYIVLLYLSIVFLIIWSVYMLSSYSELLVILLLFLTVPPFILFFMKYYMILSLEFNMKLVLFLLLFDVFVLLYYFGMIFSQFMIMEVGGMVYMMSVAVLICALVCSNCVTMIVLYES